MPENSVKFDQKSLKLLQISYKTPKINEKSKKKTSRSWPEVWNKLLKTMKYVEKNR